MYKFDLKELREKSNMSQTELAANMGVDRSTVSKWESGEREPNMQRLVELAQLLNVSLDSIIKYDKAQKEISKMYMDMLTEPNEVGNFVTQTKSKRK